jgi:hypothetical protein
MKIYSLSKNEKAFTGSFENTKAINPNPIMTDDINKVKFFLDKDEVDQLAKIYKFEIHEMILTTQEKIDSIHYQIMDVIEKRLERYDFYEKTIDKSIS